MQIAIVGAGPVGCYLANLLEKRGIRPLVLEEHSRIGVPQHCAGLVGRDFFENLSLPLPSHQLIKNRINGAIVSYKEHSFVVEKKGIALVIDRKMLDEKLAEGLCVKRKIKLLGIEKKKGKYLLRTTGGIFPCQVLIGADGATSTVRKLTGINLNPSYYRGVQFIVRQKNFPSDMLQIHFVRPFLNFCWIIPEREDIIRVGALSPRKPFFLLKEFIRERKIKGEILEKMAGIISIGYGETQKDNMALVGGAACQVKPLSGGGLSYGIRCAEILSECVAEGRLSAYPGRWEREIGREIKLSFQIRKFLEKRSNRFLEKMFYITKKNSSLIEKFFNFERHSVGVLSVAKEIGFKYRI